MFFPSTLIPAIIILQPILHQSVECRHRDTCIYLHGCLLKLAFGVKIPAPFYGQVVPDHANNESHHHWLVRFLPQYPSDPRVKGQNRPIDESIQSLKNRDTSIKSITLPLNIGIIYHFSFLLVWHKIFFNLYFYLY